MSQITVRTLDTSLLDYQNKKGQVFTITPEGAIFKGGAALKSLRNAVLEVAYDKAVTGRYRAASEVLGAAFPSILKAAVTFLGTEPHANKATFQVFVQRCHDAQPGKTGEYSQKQMEARTLSAALLGFLVPKPVNPETVENESQEAAQA